MFFQLKFLLYEIKMERPCRPFDVSTKFTCYFVVSHLYFKICEGFHKNKKLDY